MSRPSGVHPDEVTDERLFLNRRNFLRAGLLAGSSVATGLLYRSFDPESLPPDAPTEELNHVNSSFAKSYSTEESPNSLKEITTYNNFYEFSTSKTAVAKESQALITRPWTVEVGGLVHKPRTFDIDEIFGFEQEERIYRFRCVEAWSMVIPWIGFPLKKLIDQVEPFGSAQYVAFQSLYDPKVMQSSFRAGIDFPYVEGLRLDEALHPLTILATGLYGKQMPKQNGAPVRLIVPWKYGFKSIKSVVRIMLTDRQPDTTWGKAAPTEYGFYSNVNPDVPHPRWSQSQERRIGETGLRKTLPFNGYADEVASLYGGMDLRKYF